MVQRTMVHRLIRQRGIAGRANSLICVLLAALGLLPDACSALEPPAESTESVRDQRSERTLDYWAEQLSNPRFSRRQAAIRYLVAGGKESIPALKKRLDGGDLENVDSIISILAKIAETEGPWEQNGAIATLESIADEGFGAKATLSRSVLNSFAKSRQEQAIAQLLAAQVFLGRKTVSLGARSQPRDIVQIDDSWDGNLKTLAWLRWLEGISFVVVSRDEVSAELLEHVLALPDLTTLVLVNCQLEPDAVSVLTDHDAFDNLEFRYVELNSQMFADLYDVRIRNALHLMGTTIPKERAAQMRVDRPGLEISHRQGGFLGVICRNTAADICEVSDVVPGGGAANAGLQQGDVIVRIDDKKIVRFEDLQQEINRHVPGDSVSIDFLRDGTLNSAKAVLQKLRDE